MCKRKIKISFLAILVSFFHVVYVIPQEGVVPQADVVVQEETAIKTEEEAPYVKKGYVTVNFKEADIRAVLNYLSEVSGVDIVPSPEVTGTVTLKLTNKPWDTALDIIVKNYGYAYEREGNIIRVVTLESLQQAELSTEVMRLNYANAQEVAEALTDILGERGKLKADPRTNSIIVTDLPTNIYKIKRVMEQLDKKTPQIMIESRILETLLEKDEKMGIDWTMKIAAIGAKRPSTIPFYESGLLPVLPHEIVNFLPRGKPSTSTSTTPSGGGAAVETTTESDFPSGTAPFPYVETDQFTYGTLDFSQFQAVLELLKQRRKTQVISNPRITTLNNKEAKILVGRVYNFPLFDQSADTGRWTISGYEAKELGIKLMVTPHVNENNEIVVDLKPEISNYLGLEKISEELSAPLWSTREAETQVMVADGATIFIGGLIKENNIEIEKKVPLLGDLFGDWPFIGGLVKHKGEDKEKTELVFFITVHIVKDVRELIKIAQKGLTETELPSEVTAPSSEVKIIEEEVTVEMPMSAPEAELAKKTKPLFDFRKKKKTK